METNDYCSYELSLALKKAGFDEPCDHYWYKEFTNSDEMALRQASADDFNNDDWDVPHCSAPTLWQAQKWLRDKCGLHINVIPCVDYAEDADGRRCDEWYFWGYDIECIATATIVTESNSQFDTYEQALQEGIKAALDLINPENG